MNANENNYVDLLNCKTSDDVHRAVLSWSSNKSNQEHLIRSAILEIHILVEKNLKDILYESLVDSITERDDINKYNHYKQKLQEQINKMSFNQTYKLLKPSLNSFENSNLNNIHEINKVRNLAVHGDNDIVLYKGRNPFKDHDCLAQIFFEGWAIRQTLSDYFEVVIDSKRCEFEKLISFYRKHNKDKV